MSDSPELAAILARDADPWNEKVTRHQREQDGVADRRALLRMLYEALKERDEARDKANRLATCLAVIAGGHHRGGAAEFAAAALKELSTDG